MGCMEWHPTQWRTAVAEGSSERPRCCRKEENDQEKGTPKAKATLMEQGPCRDMSVRHQIWAHYIRSIRATWHLSIHKFSFDNPLGFRPKSKTVKIKMIRSRADLEQNLQKCCSMNSANCQTSDALHMHSGLVHTCCWELLVRKYEGKNSLLQLSASHWIRKHNHPMCQGSKFTIQKNATTP